MAAALHSFTDVSDDLESELTCVICKGILTDPRTLVPCLHTFCFKCIKICYETCVEERKTLKCPTCRVVVVIEGDISKIPSSFTHISLLQIYQKCLTSSHEKVDSEKSAEDAKKLTRENIDRLDELLIEYNKELKLSDENMRRIQYEADTAKVKVHNVTRALMKILQDDENASIAAVDKILLEQRRKNEDDKSKVIANIHQVAELKRRCQAMSDKNIETFSSEDRANLQEIYEMTIQKTKGIKLSKASVKHNSSLCYIPNPEVASVMQKLKFGEILDPTLCSIEDVSSIRCGFINEFRIVTRNPDGNVCYTNVGSIYVQIRDVDGDDVKKTLTETEPGRFSVKYRAKKPSPYKVVVSIGGKEIKNSPQNVETIDAKAEFKPLRLIDLREMSSPFALAISDRGDMAVVNNRRGDDVSVVLYNADGEYLREFGGAGSGAGQLSHPYGIIFNEDHIVVSGNDSGQCMREFDINGTYKKTPCKLPEGMFGTGMCKSNDSIMCLTCHADTDFNKDAFIFSFDRLNHLHGIKLNIPNDGHETTRPWSLAYAKNKYFVTFLQIDTVFVFDDKGSLLDTFGQKGNEEGQFNDACGLAAFGKEMLLVCDAFNHRVQVLSQEGQFIRSFGSYGSAAGQMNVPGGVAVAPDGRVFVLELGGKRVQVWR